jgi:hypothetical protein
MCRVLLALFSENQTKPSLSEEGVLSKGADGRTSYYIKQEDIVTERV